jgi:hypothetical protein
VEVVVELSLGSPSPPPLPPPPPPGGPPPKRPPRPPKSGGQIRQKGSQKCWPIIVMVSRNGNVPTYYNFLVSETKRKSKGKNIHL